MKNVCILPWIHVSTTTKGSLRICCESTQSFYKDKAGLNMKVKRNRLDEVFQSELNVSIREQMLKGERPLQCQSCYASEDSSGTSPRLNFNQRFSHLWDFVEKNQTAVKYLDLRLGNTCNLRCVMCSPQNSSQFMKLVDDPELQRDMSWTDDKSYLQNIENYFPTIEELYFTGGEPFLIEDHYTLLEKIIQKGYAEKISIKYTTNGTVFSERLRQLWKNFKSISVGISIDGIGELDEKIREGSNWQIIQKNIDKILECADKVTPKTCVMNRNVHGLIDIFEYCYTKNFESRFPFLNILYSPQHLSINHCENKLQIADTLTLWHKNNRARYKESEQHFVDRLLFVAETLRQG